MPDVPPPSGPPATEAMPGYGPPPGPGAYRPPPTEAMPGFGPPPGPQGPYGPPPGPGPGPYGAAPFPGPPGRKSNAPFLVVALLVVVAVAGIAFAVSQNGDDKQGSSGGIAAGGQPEAADTPPSDDGDVPSAGEVDTPTLPDVADEPADTLPEVTTPPVEPAQAAVHDCIAVDTSGYMTGTGSCSDGGTPYVVTEVVDGLGPCSDPDASFTPSGGYLLCLEVNLVLNHCYEFPEGASGGVDGWITAADACKAPGTVHVIDIVPGVDNGDYCTTDYEWNHWYGFYAPDMVACVMKY